MIEEGADGDLVANIGKQDRVLKRGVGIANEDDVLAFIEGPIARRTIGHALAGQFFFAGIAELPVLAAGRDDDAMAFMSALRWASAISLS